MIVLRVTKPTDTVVTFAELPIARHGRHINCVEAWPDCVDGTYNPSCCRFPKSCSCDNVHLLTAGDRVALAVPWDDFEPCVATAYTTAVVSDCYAHFTKAEGFGGWVVRLRDMQPIADPIPVALTGDVTVVELTP